MKPKCRSSARSALPGTMPWSPAGAPIRRQGQVDDGGQHRGGKHGDPLGGEIGGRRGRLATAMNSDIVKAMPAKAPAPASWRKKYSSRSTAKPSWTASAETATSPGGLPITSPAMIASIRSSWPPAPR